MNGRSLKRGAVAGFLAATAVIVWFFFVDLLRGQPLMTPAFLAGTLLGVAPASVGVGTIALYTAIHYAVFIILGLIMARAVAWGGVAPGAVAGIVLGLVFFDLVFYAGLVISGVDVLRAIGWPLVLVGNVAAGLTLSGWLRFTSPKPVRSWGEILRRHRAVREGVYSGIIGGIAVAGWFFVFDLATHGALFTPGALGSALFLGAHGPADVRITAGTVLGYTVVHFAAFCVIGFVAAGLLVFSERAPSLLFALLLLFVALETVLIGLLAIFASWVLSVLGLWSVALGNIIAAGAMGGYFWRVHPELGAAFADGVPLEDHVVAMGG